MIADDYRVCPFVAEEKLYRFCKDEGLDYLHTLSNKKERRGTGKALIFLKSLRHKPKQKSLIGECRCGQYLNEPKGLEL